MENAISIETPAVESVEDLWAWPVVGPEKVSKMTHGALSRSAVYRAIDAGTIPAVRIGHKLLIPVAGLRRALGIDQ